MIDDVRTVLPLAIKVEQAGGESEIRISAVKYDTDSSEKFDEPSGPANAPIFGSDWKVDAAAVQAFRTDDSHTIGASRRTTVAQRHFETLSYGYRLSLARAIGASMQRAVSASPLFASLQTFVSANAP